MSLYSIILNALPPKALNVKNLLYLKLSMHNISRYLCKKRRLLLRVSKRVNLPGRSGPTTTPETVVEELETQRVLVNDRIVVCGRLIIHTPTTESKLELACWKNTQ